MVKKANTSSLRRPKYLLRRTRQRNGLCHAKENLPNGNYLLKKKDDYNSSNIPRNINTKIRTPMDKKPEYKEYYQKADSRLYNPTYSGHKINNPLFILKLHSCLSVLPNFLQLFCCLTDGAA